MGSLLTLLVMPGLLGSDKPGSHRWGVLECQVSESEGT